MKMKFRCSFLKWSALLGLSAVAASVLLVPSARAVSLAYVTFATNDFNENVQLGTGVGGFTLGNAPGAGSSIVSNMAQLTYTGLQCDTNSRGVARVPNTTVSANRQAGRLFVAPVTSGNVYASFLVKVVEPTTGNRCLFQFGPTNGNPVSAGVFISDQNQIFVNKGNLTTFSTPIETGLVTGTTNLIVFRYSFASENPAEAAVWVNPAPGTFGVAEGSVPAPDSSTTSGGSAALLASFSLPQGRTDTSTATGYGSGTGFLHMDEIRVADSWAEVTPPVGACSPASVVTSPTDVPITAGVSATFTVIPGGTSPTLQWQVSTNGGSTWNNVVGGFGATTVSYTTPFLTTNDNNNRYRSVVSVECGGGSSQASDPATVTVEPSVSTPNGIVMNDTWADGARDNPPFDTNNSIWYGSGLSTGLDVMFGTPSGSATLWLGYFIDTTVETPLPVHLDIGKMLNVSIDFTADNIVENGGNALRIGVFDYSDANAFVTTDAGAAGSGGTATGVRGYMFTPNWGTTFNDNTPMELYLRNVLNSANLMGSSGDFVSLGEGPVGGTFSNTPAFKSGTNYTIRLSVARTADRSVDITSAISGGGSNWTFTVTETNYVYHRFDAFGIRAVNAGSTASLFNFTRFKVEVTNAPAAALTPIPLAINQSGTNVILSWANSGFNLQAAPAVTGTYTNIPGATSPYTNAAGGTQRYFRLLGQ